MTDRMSMERPLRYNWNDMVYFLEVARQRSLTRAAQKLGVDHTTVSRRIRELESCFNCALFVRTKSGFVPTDTGYRLVEFAEGMESQAKSIADLIGVGGSDTRGAVRIASMEGIGSMYVTQAVAEFNRQYPAIQVELVTDFRMLDLSRREADVFLSFFRPRGKRLSISKLGSFRVSLYASPAYLEREGVPNTAAQLEKHSFADFIEELVHVQENRWLSDILRPEHIAFRSTSLVAQAQCAASGQAIAMLPSFVAANHPILVPVMPDVFTVRDIWLSVHQDLLHISRVRAVTRFLEQRVSDDADFLMRAQNLG